MNIRLVILSFKWMLSLLFLLVVVVYIVKLISFLWFSSALSQAFNIYPLLSIGLPVAALMALGLVLSLEQESSKIKFKIIGLELQGVAGQLILWVICFLSIIIAIKWLIKT